MVKKLMILRHAKAAIELAGSDFDRPLTERGRNDVLALAAHLCAQNLVCDLAMVSSAVRTCETAALLQQGWSKLKQLEHDEVFYLATAGDLLNALQKCDEQLQQVMVIGHNPGLHQLGHMLTQPQKGEAYAELELSFPTCALLTLSLEIAHWEELAPECAALKELWTPRLGSLV